MEDSRNLLMLFAAPVGHLVRNIINPISGQPFSKMMMYESMNLKIFGGIFRHI